MNLFIIFNSALNQFEINFLPFEFVISKNLIDTFILHLIENDLFITKFLLILFFPLLDQFLLTIFQIFFLDYCFTNFLFFSIVVFYLLFYFFFFGIFKKKIFFK